MFLQLSHQTGVLTIIETIHVAFYTSIYYYNIASKSVLVINVQTYIVRDLVIYYDNHVRNHVHVTGLSERCPDGVWSTSCVGRQT